jgi:predicted porin
VAFKQRIGLKSREIAKNLCQPRFDLVEYTQLPVWRLAKGAFPLAPISTLEKLSMKKTLIAMAAVAVTGAASAQVTMYGLIDQFYGNVDVVDAAGADAASVTQLGATSSTKTASGLQSGGLSGSRWGIKGSEDLGGGLTASFVLESAITATTGASTGFTRNSNVALAGGFGTVSLGHQYTPSFSAIGGTDIDGTSAFSTSNLFPTAVRASNSMMYTSPSMGGATAKLMMINESTGITGAASTKGYDASLTYSAGPLTVVGATSSIKTKTAAVAGVTAVTSTTAQVLAVAATDGKVTSTTVGASYNLGVATVMANVINYKATNNVTAASSFEASETNLGVAMPMGAVTLLAGWGNNKANLVNTASVKTNDYIVGANYAMSKRTDVYARISKTGVINSSFADAGKVTRTAVGLRHKF